MLFTQFEFPVFFAVVLIVAVVSQTSGCSFVLLGAIIISAYWDYRFCRCFGTIALVDYSIARRMVCVSSVRMRRLSS